MSVPRELFPLLTAIRRTLREFAPEDRVLVACSGGADSLALAAAVANVRPGSAAVVIDHDLQPGSDSTAQLAAEQCRGLGLDPVTVIRVNVQPNGDGLEAAARRARYAGLSAEAHRLGCRAILLAHTLDDQAETVLMRLARGSGARSLSGMAERDGLLVRPFLELTREQVRGACRAMGLEPHEDPHNFDTRFARVRVRRRVMPELVQELGADVVLGLARTARLLRDDADALDSQADDLFKRMGQTDGPEISLDVAALAALPRALRTRVLRVAALQAGCPGSALTRDHVLALEALVSDWHGQGPLDLPARVGGRRSSGRLYLWNQSTSSPRSNPSS